MSTLLTFAEIHRQITALQKQPAPEGDDQDYDFGWALSEVQDALAEYKVKAQASNDGLAQWEKRLDDIAELERVISELWQKGRDLESVDFREQVAILERQGETRVQIHDALRPGHEHICSNAKRKWIIRRLAKK